MADDQWDRARVLMRGTAAGRRWWGFNGGGSASGKAKDDLRALLAEHAGDPDAEALRFYFNEHRRTGDRIRACDVAAAVEVLGGMGH